MANDLLLRNVPKDILKILLTIQGEEKNNRVVKQYSISAVVFKIIREHDELKQKK